jgi:hypothetical protein
MFTKTNVLAYKHDSSTAHGKGTKQWSLIVSPIPGKEVEITS